MFVPKSKIEFAVSTDNSRYTLAAVKYDVEKARFLATDGHILASIPAQTAPEDHSVLIGTDTLKALRQTQKQLGKDAHLEVKTNGKIVAECGAVKAEFPVTEGTFPNADAVKPEFKGAATVCFDAALLMRLAKALGEECTDKSAVVSLWIKDKSSVIGVKIEKGEQALSDQCWGALMPFRGSH